MSPIPEAREEAMQAAFDFAEEDFKTTYRDFVVAYANEHAGEFTAEDCQLAYKATSNPQPEEWRATGNIIKSLIAEGRLVKTGFDWSAVRGAPIAKYRRGK
jgi:hypothetical protein